MEKIKDYRLNKLKSLCHQIMINYPEAIGMAVLELDCGCINVCGVSAWGDPVGVIQTISGQPPGEHKKSPVCLTCYKEKGKFMHRVVYRGMMWPGDKTEKPERELRLLIGRKVFGPDYTEPED